MCEGKTLRHLEMYRILYLSRHQELNQHGSLPHLVNLGVRQLELHNHQKMSGHLSQLPWIRTTTQLVLSLNKNLILDLPEQQLPSPEKEMMHNQMGELIRNLGRNLG